MNMETLQALWAGGRARESLHTCTIQVGDAFVLGAGTIIFDRQAREPPERATALLCAAAAVAPTEAHERSVARAADAFRQRNAALAATHLAMVGLGRLAHPIDDARRLFFADTFMREGAAPQLVVDILHKLALERAAAQKDYSPDQPRVPAGSGEASGRWTRAGDGGTDNPGDAAKPAAPVVDASAAPVSKPGSEPSVPTKLRQTTPGSLPLMAEFEASDGHALQFLREDSCRRRRSRRRP